jgi:NADPH-dependent curcumin reductase CurA
MVNKAIMVHQVNRPQGWPATEHFAFVEAPISRPEAGEALVENIYLSVDPYMRSSMDAVWDLHAPLDGRAIGRVLESRIPHLVRGDLVLHRKGWRTHALVRAEDVQVLPRVPAVPSSAYLGILGGTGLAAYVALTRIARLQTGESMFISAAAGGVGSAAGQIARLLGASRVIGSAGSAAKVTHLTKDLGFDAAFDYHDGPVSELLTQVAPQGIDIYLDNVGGEHLEAAISALHEHGRIALCGAVAQYNSTEPPAAPRNLFGVVLKSLRLEGFSVRDYQHVRGELEELLTPHIQSGRIVVDQTVVEGFSQIVDAFLGMLRGDNMGKMIVQITN